MIICESDLLVAQGTPEPNADLYLGTIFVSLKTYRTFVNLQSNKYFANICFIVNLQTYDTRKYETNILPIFCKFKPS